jgi:hypothetical protein
MIKLVLKNQSDKYSRIERVVSKNAKASFLCNNKS